MQATISLPSSAFHKIALVGLVPSFWLKYCYKQMLACQCIGASACNNSLFGSIKSHILKHNYRLLTIPIILKKRPINLSRASTCFLSTYSQMHILSCCIYSYKKMCKQTSQSKLIADILILSFFCQNENAWSMKVAPPLPRPPPVEPTFTCPVCMGPYVEEMSTKCGHIFCKKCIRASIAVRGQCPTCRGKISMKNTIRVFLPAAN